eukprot:SAG22_NODE_7190_length_765_cov_0.662162_1_plen_28_part_01
MSSRKCSLVHATLKGAKVGSGVFRDILP